MKVEIYDQFKNVFNSEGELIHSSSSSLTFVGEFETLSEAIEAVTNEYENSKSLGECEDKVILSNRGYAEMFINFNDGRVLHRIIYTSPIPG